jgi:hypothetical protein
MLNVFSFWKFQAFCAPVERCFWNAPGRDIYFYNGEREMLYIADRENERPEVWPFHSIIHGEKAVGLGERQKSCS